MVGGLTNLSGGTYSLQGGKLSTDEEIIGNLGTGSFTQSGGTNTDSGSFNLGSGTQSSGSYSLSAGSLAVSGNLNVGNSGSGTFLQTGGNASVTGSLSVLTLGQGAAVAGRTASVVPARDYPRRTSTSALASAAPAASRNRAELIQLPTAWFSAILPTPADRITSAADR